MKKKLKSALSLLLCLIMVFGAVAVGGEGIELPSISDIFGTKATAATSGTCGDNLTWSFDESTGTLEISGTGDMADIGEWKGDNIIDIVTATTVTIENGVTSICADAFSYWHNLVNITIPESVISIDITAFQNCSKLTSITVNQANKSYMSKEGVLFTKDGSELIVYPKSKAETSYKVPDGVTHIYYDAFSECKNITSIEIPNSVIDIDERALYSCLNLSEINVDEKNPIYSSENGVLFNKDKTKLLVYPRSKRDPSYSIPSSVISCKDAFRECSYLEEINIPGSVAELGNIPFFKCPKLAFIKVDGANENFSSDNYGTLYDKSKATLLQLPEGLTAETFYLPDTISKINAEYLGFGWTTALSYCNGVEKFIVSDNNEFFSSDSQGVLYNKDKTELIKYPGGSKAETYVLPVTVTSIDEGDVLSSKYLQRIEVAPGNELFYNDENNVLFAAYGDRNILVKIPNNIQLRIYKIPESVTGLAQNSWSNLKNLKKIHIPIDLRLDEVIYWYGYSGCLASDTTFNSEWPFNINTVICAEQKPEGYELLSRIVGNVDLLFELCDGNHTEHKHSPKTVTVPASCTVDGMEYEVCSECGETIGTPTVIKAKGHTEVKDIAVKPTCTATGLTEGAHCSVCNTIIKKQEVIPATGHTEVKDIAVKPTCTATGLTEGAHCSVCNTTIKKQEVIPATGHTSGDWIVVTEPTSDTDGKRVKKCTVCGTILSEEILPKLTVAVDEKTGIELDYSGGDYSGKVELSVEETFDGAAFNLVNTQFNVSQSFIYDIKMTVDGVETQPTGTVKVRIPLPEGFDPARTFVYHVDTETGKVVKMAATYKDGYLEFETDHFSYYAVVEEAKPCKLSINTPSTTTVSYGFTLNLHANVTDMPDGARVVWSMDGSGFELIPSADGMTCGVKSVSKGSATITAKVVDKNGNAVKDANGNEITASQRLTSKAGFFQKLAAFFKKLFGSNMVIPSSLNKLIK